MDGSEVLNFENGRALSNLYAGRIELLQEAEQTLGARFVTRDSWVRIEGDATAVAKGKEFFECLREAARDGVRIREHEFRHVLKTVQEGQSSRLADIWSTAIPVSPKKPQVRPKNLAQKIYIDTIRKYDLTFCLGSAGTGKTYLAVAMAVAALKKEEVSRIILTRPAVEAGEALGFLPGDLQQKISPYLRPLHDSFRDMLEADELQRYADKEAIEVAPLAYMRGRTLSHAFVILDEAQNTTTEQMFMLLTRLGPGSRCVVTGDPTQVDLPRNVKSGLAEAAQALEGIDGIAFMRFADSDIVRHDLVGRIVEAYRRHRGERKTSMIL